MSFLQDKWMQTYTGRQFYLFKPDPADINILDISRALSHQCRWNGHTTHFYSIASHSVRVSQLCSPPAKRWGLMHDAAEAYTGDVISPFKAGLPDFQLAERRIERAVKQKFGIDVPDEVAREVKQVDMWVAFEEARFLLPHPQMVERWGVNPPPLTPYMEAILLHDQPMDHYNRANTRPDSAMGAFERQFRNVFQVNAI